MRVRAVPTSKMGGTNTITVKPQHRDHHRGLRTVSLLEAAKGVLVLLAAFGFAEIIRHNIDLEDAAQNLLYFLHVDPDRRLSHALMHAADRMMDADLLTVLGIALVYSGCDSSNPTACGANGCGPSGWRSSQARSTYHSSFTS